MAEPLIDVRTIASWSARDTDVATINGAIRRLRGHLAAAMTHLHREFFSMAESSR